MNSKASYWLLLILGAAGASGGDVRGTVRLDGVTPLKGLVVEVEERSGQTPGQLYLTRTGPDGTFRVAGVQTERVQVSVRQDGNLVYRGNALSGSDLNIHLVSTPPPLPGSLNLVALAMFPDDSLVIASSRGTLHRVKGRELKTVAETAWKFTDVAGGLLGGQPALFACASGEAVSLLQFDLMGAILKLGKSWRVGPSGAPCSGVAFGAETLYAGVDAEKAIYRMRKGDSRPLWFAGVGLMREIGAMAVDGERLFVADPVQGSIYVIGLDGKRLRRFAHGLGPVHALAVDAARRRLYAGVATPGRIWQFDLTSASPAAQRFASDRTLRSVYALGVSSGGTVWAGDWEQKALAGFAPEAPPPD